MNEFSIIWAQSDVCVFVYAQSQDGGWQCQVASSRETSTVSDISTITAGCEVSVLTVINACRCMATVQCHHSSASLLHTFEQRCCYNNNNNIGPRHFCGRHCDSRSHYVLWMNRDKSCVQVQSLLFNTITHQILDGNQPNMTALYTMAQLWIDYSLDKKVVC